ncbi:pumilio homolog 24-like [Triticum dicoccoides]|uniref:pumilio homolog 24-like n=1 Tax=Triticum dicoccoides TaxID=85692 RepID=UPI001891715D|nr:pumilio homolog 24-like [Triticum dicoccoides]
MAGGGDHPGAKKRKRVAAGRPEGPSKRAKGKKPYEAPAARGGGGSKEEPQPVTAMDERVAAEEMSESTKLDNNLVKELTMLCVKMKYHNTTTIRRCRLVTEALRKMDGKYLEIARSPTACVLQATRPQKIASLLVLYSTELQLSNDLKEEKPCRFSLLNIISKLGLQKSSVLQYMTTVIQPVLEKGIVEYSIVHTVILEYLTIADKTSALDVIRQLIPHLTQRTYAVDELSGVARLLGKSEVEKKRSSKPLLIQIMQMKEGLKLGLACLKHGLAEDRKMIIKSLKGRIMKLALSDYRCLFVICLLSIVDNTELVTEVVIDELKKQLKELIFDKNGRHPLLQLFHPLCSRYLTLGELFYLNYNVPSLVSKVNFGSKLDDVADKEHGGSEDTLIASDSKEDLIKRRQELLVKSELYEVLIETCIENVGQLLRTNFGKDVLYEVAVGGKNNFLEGVTDRIHVLHNAIACDAARLRTDDGDEHAFDNHHSSRIIRRMILDCPAFAATLWEKALEGKCKLYADGFSSMVLAAYLESPDSMVKDLAKSELQPLIDGGILKPQEHKAEEEKSAMECSSDESSSELSDTDTGYHAKKAYKDLKSGKLVARFGTDRFRCPFCPEKKKLDYRYRELIQHVIVVGASRRPWKVRANHRALAKHLETDHADAPGSSKMPLRQAEALYLSKIKSSQAGPRSTCKPSR